MKISTHPSWFQPSWFPTTITTLLEAPREEGWQFQSIITRLAEAITSIAGLTNQLKPRLNKYATTIVSTTIA